jgi:putative transcriptional regulator
MLNLMVEVKLNELLKERKKSLYALAKESEITYAALLRINKNKVSSMSFDVLEKLCKTLNCTPNDLLSIKSNN